MELIETCVLYRTTRRGQGELEKIIVKPAQGLPFTLLAAGTPDLTDRPE
jgi:hypothetical protein